VGVERSTRNAASIDLPDGFEANEADSSRCVNAPSTDDFGSPANGGMIEPTRESKTFQRRCTWCGHDLLSVAYHDEEWGSPIHDDRRLFECLMLEGAQAGLSWLTVLNKREHYRAAFHAFDCERIATYSKADEARLLADPGIVRNRLKIEAAIKNARAVLDIKEDYGS
jgi:hypothetical protein